MKHSQEEKNKKEKPLDVLKKLNPSRQVRKRLQFCSPNKRILSYCCGDGLKAVTVNSRKKLSISEIAFKTRLTQKIVEYYLSDKEIIPGIYIADKLQAIIKAYIYFDDSRLYIFVAMWIVGTYLYSIFGHYGYLFLYSKLMRSGKTRAQEIISHLAFEATTPQNAPTPAVIRELSAEGGTVQLDTLERWEEKNQESFSAAMEILDAAFRDGGQVSKMVVKGKGAWVKEIYPVYAPYMLTGIYKSSLSDTALDRSFSIEMRRKPTWVKKKRYNSFICEKECRPVRGCLYVWALQNVAKISSIYHDKGFLRELDQLHLNDRAADIWRPILAVAKATGFEKESKEWADLTSLAREMGGDPEVAEEVRQLAIIRILRSKATNEKKIVGMTSELLKIVQDNSIEIKAIELNHFLTQWDFRQKDIRFSTGPRRAWELEDEKLAEVEKQLSITMPSNT